MRPHIIGPMNENVGQLALSVVGAGYTGLVTAACLARMGHVVRCVDRNSERVADLSRGVLPFREPGLDEAISAGLASGRLSFSDDPATIRGTEAALIAVGTLDADGEWSADHVEAAVVQVARDLSAPRTIVVRSTLLPGTAARLDALARQIDERVEIVLNPEFTRQGSAVRDFFTPDRIVIGTTRPAAESAATELLRRVYSPLSTQLVVTDAASAELIKSGANVFLAMKIAFGNEIARVAAATGADALAVLDGIGLDNRIGRDYLSPGPGFGGSCLPSQARALPRMAARHGAETPLIAAIDESNGLQPGWVVAQLEHEMGDLRDTRITILGLTFKAGTDDLRESRSLKIARLLATRGARLTLHDPLALAAGLDALHGAGVDAAGASDAVAALSGADAVVVATEWPAYRALDWSAAAEHMAGHLVVDARGIVDLDAAAAAGLRVLVHGRSTVRRIATHS